jgi:hypothetical protein
MVAELVVMKADIILDWRRIGMNNHTWMWDELKEWAEKGEKELLDMSRKTNDEEERKRLFARHLEINNFIQKMNELEG